MANEIEKFIHIGNIEHRHYAIRTIELPFRATRIEEITAGCENVFVGYQLQPSEYCVFINIDPLGKSIHTIQVNGRECKAEGTPVDVIIADVKNLTANIAEFAKPLMLYVHQSHTCYAANINPEVVVPFLKEVPKFAIDVTNVILIKSAN